MTKSTGKPPPPGSGGGDERDHAHAGDLRQLRRQPRPAAAACVFLRSLQGFVTMPPKPPVGSVIWNDALRLRERLVDVVDLRR